MEAARAKRGEASKEPVKPPQRKPAAYPKYDEKLFYQIAPDSPASSTRPMSESSVSSSQYKITADEKQEAELIRKLTKQRVYKIHNGGLQCFATSPCFVLLHETQIREAILDNMHNPTCKKMVNLMDTCNWSAENWLQRICQDIKPELGNKSLQHDSEEFLTGLCNILTEVIGLIVL